MSSTPATPNLSPSASPTEEKKFEFNNEDDKKLTGLPEVMFSQQSQPFYVLQHTPDFKHIEPVLIGPVPEIKHFSRDENDDDDLFVPSSLVASDTPPKELKEKVEAKEVRQSWVDLMAGTEDEQKLKAKVAAQKAAFGDHLCSLLESESKKKAKEETSASSVLKAKEETNASSVLKEYQDTFTHYYDWTIDYINTSKNGFNSTSSHRYNFIRKRPPAGLSMDHAELAYWAYLNAAIQQVDKTRDRDNEIRESARQAAQGIEVVKSAPTLTTLVSKKPAQLPTMYQDIEQRIVASSQEVTQYNEQQAAIAKKAEDEAKASALSSSGTTDSSIDEKQKALKVEPKKLAIGQGMGIQDVLTHFFNELKEVKAEQTIADQENEDGSKTDEIEAAKERIKQARRAFDIYVHSLPERELQELFRAELKEVLKLESVPPVLPSTDETTSLLSHSMSDSSAPVEQPKPETVIEIKLRSYTGLKQHFDAAMRILGFANAAVEAQSQEIDLEEPAATADKTSKQLLAERVRAKLQAMGIIPAPTEAPRADSSTTEESSPVTTTQSPALDTLDDEEVIRIAGIFNTALKEVGFKGKFWDVYARLMQREVPYQHNFRTDERSSFRTVSHTVEYTEKDRFSIPTTVDTRENELVIKEEVAAFFSRDLFEMQNRSVIALAVKQYLKYLPDQKRHPLLKLASDHWRALVVILALTGISVALLTFFNAPLLLLAALGSLGPLVFAALAFIVFAIVWAVIKFSYNRWQGKERPTVTAIKKLLQRLAKLGSQNQTVDVNAQLNDEAVAESLGKLPQIRWDGRRLPSKPAWVVAMLCASTAMVLILSGVEILGFIPGVTWTSLAVLSAAPVWQAAVVLLGIMLGAAVIGILLTEVIRWALTSRMDDDKGTKPKPVKKEGTEPKPVGSRKNSKTGLEMEKLNSLNPDEVKPEDATTSTSLKSEPAKRTSLTGSKVDGDSSSLRLGASANNSPVLTGQTNEY